MPKYLEVGDVIEVAEDSLIREILPPKAGNFFVVYKTAADDNPRVWCESRSGQGGWFNFYQSGPQALAQEIRPVGRAVRQWVMLK